VYLIGAGPGDPELMTLTAARAPHAAEVVLIDDLVNCGCLAHARSDARVIEVGKRGGCKSTSQLFIEKLLVNYPKQGHVVARLKGGDPFSGANVLSRGIAGDLKGELVVASPVYSSTSASRPASASRTRRCGCRSTRCGSKRK
jgi:precorrin-3B methylase